MNRKIGSILLIAFMCALIFVNLLPMNRVAGISCSVSGVDYTAQAKLASSTASFTNSITTSCSNEMVLVYVVETTGAGFTTNQTCTSGSCAQKLTSSGLTFTYLTSVWVTASGPLMFVYYNYSSALLVSQTIGFTASAGQFILSYMILTVANAKNVIDTGATGYSGVSGVSGPFTKNAWTTKTPEFVSDFEYIGFGMASDSSCTLLSGVTMSSNFNGCFSVASYTNLVQYRIENSLLSSQAETINCTFGTCGNQNYAQVITGIQLNPSTYYVTSTYTGYVAPNSSQMGNWIIPFFWIMIPTALMMALARTLDFDSSKFVFMTITGIVFGCLFGVFGQAVPLGVLAIFISVYVLYIWRARAQGQSLPGPVESE